MAHRWLLSPCLHVHHAPRRLLKREQGATRFELRLEEPLQTRARHTATSVRLPVLTKRLKRHLVRGRMQEVAEAVAEAVASGGGPAVMAQQGGDPTSPPQRAAAAACSRSCSRSRSRMHHKGLYLQQQLGLE